jgi:hypothetical protein
MSLRIPMFLLLSLLIACSAAGLDEEDGAAPSADESVQRLTFESVVDTSVFANDTVELAVRYEDAAGGGREGVLVEFSLTSATSPGASLSPSRSATDGQGIARTTLRAGSTAGELQVRARTGSTVAYLPLAVRQANASRVMVEVSYAGLRDVASYTVTALPGMTCATALKSGLAGEVAYNFEAEDETVAFELGAGLSAAIVGWGRDATGAKLVRGCREVTASTKDTSKTQMALELTLEDLPIALDGALSVELELNVAGPTQQLAAAAKRSVDGVLMPGGTYSMFAEADYYLDAVERWLAAQGNTSGAQALAAQRASSTLSATLGPALTQGKVGPGAVGAAVGALLTTRGAGITLRTSFEAGALTPISDLTVRSADDTQSLRWTNVNGTKLPVVTSTTRYEAARAELSFSSLRVELPLGSYGTSLLTGLEAESSGVPAVLSQASGCSSVVGPWWIKNSLLGVSDTSEAIAACERAVVDLTARIKADLAALDASSPALVLAGDVQVHDRSEDGKVDDLGPTMLAGTWGAENIQAELRVPVRTAFAR